MVKGGWGMGEVGVGGVCRGGCGWDEMMGREMAGGVRALLRWRDILGWKQGSVGSGVCAWMHGMGYTWRDPIALVVGVPGVQAQLVWWVCSHIWRGGCAGRADKIEGDTQVSVRRGGVHAGDTAGQTAPRMSIGIGGKGVVAKLSLSSARWRTLAIRGGPTWVVGQA